MWRMYGQQQEMVVIMGRSGDDLRDAVKTRNYQLWEFLCDFGMKTRKIYIDALQMETNATN